MPKTYVQSKNGFLVAQRVNKFTYRIYINSDRISTVCYYDGGLLKIHQAVITEQLLKHLTDVIKKIHINEAK